MNDKMGKNKKTKENSDVEKSNSLESAFTTHTHTHRALCVAGYRQQQKKKKRKRKFFQTLNNVQGITTIRFFPSPILLLLY